MNEDQSYEWNGVKPVDTIVMVPTHVIQETCKIQDSSVTVQVPQTEQPPASNSVRETVNTQDSSLKVGGKKSNKNDQVPQTKQSPQSKSDQEITRIQICL